MLSYPGLRPRHIDEEFTLRQIKEHGELCVKQPPSAYQLHKLNNQIEGLIKALCGSGGEDVNEVAPSIECAWQSSGTDVGVMWDGC